LQPLNFACNVSALRSNITFYIFVVLVDLTTPTFIETSAVSHDQLKPYTVIF